MMPRGMMGGNRGFCGEEHEAACRAAAAAAKTLRAAF